MSSNASFAVNVDTQYKWDEPLHERFLEFKERYGWTEQRISRDMELYFGKSKDPKVKVSKDGEKSTTRPNTGMGMSTLISYITYKWPSSQERLEVLEARIRAWLDHRQHGTSDIEIDDTVLSAQLIQHGLVEAHRAKKFTAIILPSGMGKTLIARHLANVQVGGGIRIVESYDGMTTRAFLAAICRELGHPEKGSVDVLIRRVVGSLAEQPMLLVVDEANFLSTQSLNQLVYIYNQVRIGIALIGTEELEAIVRNSKLQRVHTRFKLWVRLGALSEKEIGHRLGQSFEKKEVTVRAVEMAQRASGGSYRLLDTVIESALELKEARTRGGAQPNIDKPLEWLLSPQRRESEGYEVQGLRMGAAAKKKMA